MSHAVHTYTLIIYLKSETAQTSNEFTFFGGRNLGNILMRYVCLIWGLEGSGKSRSGVCEFWILPCPLSKAYIHCNSAQKRSVTGIFKQYRDH